MIAALSWTNLLAVFCVELAGLAAFGLWGPRRCHRHPAAGGWRSRSPLAAAILWGLFCAPRASIPLPGPAVAAIKLALLAAAALALTAAERPRWAAALTAVAITTALLAQALPDPANRLPIKRGCMHYVEPEHDEPVTGTRSDYGNDRVGPGGMSERMARRAA